ncbi:LPS export ABC transporter permease LptG [Salinisphaera sp. T31B1]|uniref:LPS export ABC transporter permease LptG n=1 Tax=Salinisphaera sp. T31B1 TaxID=727963 RepID=UPI00333FA18A
MRVINRYLGLELLRAYGVVTLLLLGLFGFFDLSAELDDVGQGNYATLDAIKVTLGQLAQRAVELTPFTLLLTVVGALGLMTGRSELVVLRAAGLSPLHIARRVAGFGLIVLAAALVVQSLVAPPLSQQAQQLRATRISGGSIADDATFWMRSQDGVVHIGALENARVPLDIEILRFGPDASIERSLQAERADIQADGDWRLQDVTVKRFDGSGEISEHRDQLLWRPTLYERQLAVLDRRPDSLSPRALYRYIDYLEAHDQDAQPFRIALWQKLALPVTTLAMLLLGLPLVFVNPRGANVGLRIAIAAAIGLSGYGLIQMIGNLAFLYGLSAPLCMLAPGLALSLAALLWLRRCV